MIFCNLHESKKEIFCIQESVFVCSDCYFENHNGHQILTRKKILELIKTVPEDTELILTGRGDISEIEKDADYITIMIDKKHPFRQSVNARKGIEY